MLIMNVRYVYKGLIIANGKMPTLPQEGNFLEIQEIQKIFIVTNVMYTVLLSNNIGAIIYLSDITSEKERMLRNYK